MRAWIQYFFGVGTEIEFRNFTLAHFLPILLMLALIYLTYRCRDWLKDYRHEAVFRYIMAFALICSEMSYYWRLVGMPILGPNPLENLPVAVCGVVAVFGSYMVIGKSQTLFDICYFWLLSASVFALITPTVISYTGPTRFRYYQFWVEHTVGYVAVFYMIFVHGMRPTFKSLLKAHGALVLLAVFAYWLNQYLGSGANYLFMARPESTPSVLDILPPNFILRILVMAGVITLLFGLAYLPWYLRDKKAEKALTCQTT